MIMINNMCICLYVDIILVDGDDRDQEDHEGVGARDLV